MSGVGSAELIILILIGLIVLGPKRLPQIANQLGSWIGQARRMTRAMKRQLEDELNFDEDFKPKAPRIAPPISSSAPDPADPAYDYGQTDDHIPSEDDTHSPRHDEDGDIAEETVENNEQEKNA